MNSLGISIIGQRAEVSNQIAGNQIELMDLVLGVRVVFQRGRDVHPTTHRPSRVFAQQPLFQLIASTQHVVPHAAAPTAPLYTTRERAEREESVNTNSCECAAVLVDSCITNGSEQTHGYIGRAERMILN